MTSVEKARRAKAILDKLAPREIVVYPHPNNPLYLWAIGKITWAEACRRVGDA